MLCFIDDEVYIFIVYFGELNVGKMKCVYCIGFKNCYGSMMQVIVGVYFNFFFFEMFWKLWVELNGKEYF